MSSAAISSVGQHQLALNPLVLILKTLLQHVEVKLRVLLVYFF